MVRVFLVILISLLSGCAGMSVDNKVGVVNNTFYSSRLPDITVKVSSDFKYDGEKDNSGYGNARYSQKNTRIKSRVYYFSDRLNLKRLNINVQRLNEKNWRMTMPDYSNIKNSYSLGTEEIGGRTFQTVVYAVKDTNGTPVLLKRYGSVFGDSIRFTVYYLEKVENKWLRKESILPEEKKEFLRKFDKRANSSFVIGQYSDSLLVLSNTTNN